MKVIDINNLPFQIDTFEYIVIPTDYNIITSQKLMTKTTEDTVVYRNGLGKIGIRLSSFFIGSLSNTYAWPKFKRLYVEL